MLRQQQQTGTRCSVLLKSAHLCLFKHPDQLISLKEENQLYTNSFDPSCLLVKDTRWANLEVQYRVIKGIILSIFGVKEYFE